MVCTGLSPYRILEWFNFQSLYCILIYENHLDSGDITEPRLGMHLKQKSCTQTGAKMSKTFTINSQLCELRIDYLIEDG